MRLFRYAMIAVLIVILAMAIYQTMLWLGAWGNLNDSQVKTLDDGDQEIALIEPATSGDEWGRLITALQLLEIDWPKINQALPRLRVDLDGAFPPLTAEVPEVAFSFTGSTKRKLRLRWYKISGEHDAGSWVRKLQARPRAPLAIVGGGTSDRAVRLARRLQDAYPDPALPSPVLLITTATAEKTKKGYSLINVYQNRSFRFSFTNQKMVEALLAFVQHREYPKEDKEWAQNLWVNKPFDPQPLTDVRGSGGIMHAVTGVLPRIAQPLTNVRGSGGVTMHAVTWEDERYSQDMNALFEGEFKKRFPKGDFISEGSISYSVGGFFHPAPQEQVVVGTFLARPTPITPHSFLVLPTQTVRMRRFLINLRQRSPLEARNLVILNGDAISFHSVYRDREIIWNILDLPYSLVFFSHRNPIDHAAGFTWTRDDQAVSSNAIPQRTTTGTHDILLYRDLFEAILYAACDQGKLLGDPLQVRERLQATCWFSPPLDKGKQDSARVCNPRVHNLDAPAVRNARFFDADGNRQSHTGEHIVWVKPNFTEDRVDLVSKISVWTTLPDEDGNTWQLVEAAKATYNQSRLEEAP
jgi:hypothetical protein